MESEGEVIIITGSAIERRDLTAPAPVSIVDKTVIEASGVASIGEVLQNLPSQSNAINVQFNNGGSGATRISLRGIGADRTLVLVNGRRHVAGGTGANASVDLNTIPLAAIERVEVLKDGASAIYGSDAIAGVVNIITRRDFEGTEATAYTGTSSRGDATVYDVSVATGITSDRGNMIFSAGYFESTSAYAGDRDFSRFDYRYDWESGEEFTVGSTRVPEGMIIDYYDPEVDGAEYVGNQQWQDLVAEDGACPSGACFNDPTAGWRDFNDGGTSDTGDGDFYNYQPANYLVTPQQRFNIFATGNYKFHPSVTGFFESSFTNRQSDQLLAAEPLATTSEGLIVSRDNAYNPFGRDFRDVRRRLLEFGPRRSLQDINTFRVVTGLQGKLSERSPALAGWRWDAAYNFGRSESANLKAGNLIRSRLAAAVGPSYTNDAGQLRCGSEVAPGDPACVPLNLFGGQGPDGQGSITPEMIDYLTYTGIAKGLNEQSSVTGNLSGKLFDTPWGGDVALGLGVAYRDESGSDIPDPRTAIGDTTGSKSEPTSGDYQVAEAYGELSVVPVIGKQYADWVELSAAARVFDYSTFGTDYTWKTGGLWRIIKGFSVRGTYSTAFRAPGISDLYSGQADAFPLVSDPCDTSDGPLAAGSPAALQCQAEGLRVTEEDAEQGSLHTDLRSQIKARVGGNPDLQPETANIFTMGAVYEPRYVPGMALTLDYFHIDLTKSIQSAGASTILSSCYGAERDQASCELVTRNPATNLIDEIQDTQTNIGGTKTAGVDFNVRYLTATPTAGRFRFNLEGTWLQKYNERTPSDRLIRGKGVYDLGVYPDWRFNFSTLWGLNQWGAGANIRFINGFEECEDDDCNDPEKVRRDVGAYATADLQGTYTLESPAGISRLTLGMNNVFDADPVKIYNGFTATSEPSEYDFLGRYVYARFAQTF